MLTTKTGVNLIELAMTTDQIESRLFRCLGRFNNFFYQEIADLRSGKEMHPQRVLQLNRILSILELVSINFDKDPEHLNTDDATYKNYSKKPTTPFQMFIRDYRTNLEDGDKISYQELVKRASSTWKSVNSDVKKVYRNKAKQNLSEYQEHSLFTNLHAFFSGSMPSNEEVSPMMIDGEVFHHDSSPLVLLTDKGEDDAFESSVEPDELHSQILLQNSALPNTDSLEKQSNENTQVITPELTPQTFSVKKKNKSKQTPVKTNVDSTSSASDTPLNLKTDTNVFDQQLTSPLAEVQSPLNSKMENSSAVKLTDLQLPKIAKPNQKKTKTNQNGNSTPQKVSENTNSLENSISQTFSESIKKESTETVKQTTTTKSGNEKIKNAAPKSTDSDSKISSLSLTENAVSDKSDEKFSEDQVEKKQKQKSVSQKKNAKKTTENSIQGVDGNISNAASENTLKTLTESIVAQALKDISSEQSSTSPTLDMISLSAKPNEKKRKKKNPSAKEIVIDTAHSINTLPVAVAEVTAESQLTTAEPNGNVMKNSCGESPKKKKKKSPPTVTPNQITSQ